MAPAALAMGLCMGMAAIPVLAAVVIAAGGWRTGYAALAAVVLTAGVAPPLLLMRRRPEDVGLRPDGDAEAAGPEPDLPPALDADWSLRDAAGMRAYWLVGFGVAFVFLAAGSINLHQIPHRRRLHRAVVAPASVRGAGGGGPAGAGAGAGGATLGALP